ncbi:hypothetical protein [Weissella cibaria]|uniref:hypothetical protein n=1 Tax=Weissella cibaria TaxID=137591 RepID=UPI0011923DC1|nr:hypothetical protein [Weissella cibaria]MCS8561403.1 hypothetical protein [Weissella cibaria]MCS8565757.1 hypothetical protein [Weissella cibaria]MCS8575927.1 hypothetical protein [Weissella cibaria]MCS9988115.1 hypothetical protein [Weissella cibaria]MCS9999762.1 hypothetical protein [Weissella cibaria]
MKKIILASLLSVSMLGASTAAFAADTNVNTADNTATTKGTVNLVSGDLTLNDVTSSVSFGDLTMANVLAGNTTAVAAKDGITAHVTDLSGSGKGWHLTANYSGMKSTDAAAKPLGDTLTLGTTALKADDQMIYSADGDDVTAAKGAAIEKTTAAADVKLNVPSTATAGSYAGTINWKLVAGPAN